MSAQLFELVEGDSPLLVSFPHVGLEIPPDLAATMTPAALSRVDADWHLPRLYAFVRALGATMVVARQSRYVIDLNRPPEDSNLYPGQDTTGLVPVDTFRKEPLYLDGRAPSPAQVEARRAAYWQPYHDALSTQLKRLHQRHGVALLWDAHSIASRLPRFFEGKLPDLNLGTASGTACDPGMQAAVVQAMQDFPAFTSAVNGRFKGGYITRRYGTPANGIHAIQLEQCQSTYMDEDAPFGYREDLAAAVQPVLRSMVGAAFDWVSARAGR